MHKKLMKHLQLPAVFTASTNAYWQDPHIAQYLLKAHLNEHHEGASRTFSFMDESAEFIAQLMKQLQANHLIDYGCGPGLYCERLAGKGFSITGMDFSENSINYARETAAKKNLDITYLYDNYLNTTDEAKYDFATLIYCDYGSLHPLDRRKLLKNIRRSLKTNGHFLFDVFSLMKFEAFTECQVWHDELAHGPWSKQPYIKLNRNEKFNHHITLEQRTIITERDVQSHYIWHQFFTLEMIKKEVSQAGFTIVEVYSDVAGHPYTYESDTIALLLKK